MGREIKFRAWNKNNGHFINDFFIGDDGCVYTESSAFDDYYTEMNVIPFGEVVLQQYTGIKDKNDKEIYEGDIVSFMFLKTKVERKRGAVVFDVDELCYFIRTSSEWGYNHNLAWCDTEVIGNIYENPELLEAINEQGND